MYRSRPVPSFLFGKGKKSKNLSLPEIIFLPPRVVPAPTSTAPTPGPFRRTIPDKAGEGPLRLERCFGGLSQGVVVVADTWSFATQRNATRRPCRTVRTCGAGDGAGCLKLILCTWRKVCQIFIFQKILGHKSGTKQVSEVTWHDEVDASWHRHPRQLKKVIIIFWYRIWVPWFWKRCDGSRHISIIYDTIVLHVRGK